MTAKQYILKLYNVFNHNALLELAFFAVLLLCMAITGIITGAIILGIYYLFGEYADYVILASIVVVVAYNYAASVHKEIMDDSR